MEKDYYAILGVSPTAEQDAIHEALLRLAQKYYPNTQSSPAALARWQKIAEAWQVLNNPARKRQYDAARRLSYAAENRRVAQVRQAGPMMGKPRAARTGALGLIGWAGGVLVAVVASVILLLFVQHISLDKLLPSNAPAVAAAKSERMASPTPTREQGCAHGCVQAQAGCVIKAKSGGTSGQGFYYLPVDGDYDQVVLEVGAADRWFCTETEARTNGWTRVAPVEPATPTLAAPRAAEILPTAVPTLKPVGLVKTPAWVQPATPTRLLQPVVPPTPTSAPGFKYPAPRLTQPASGTHYSCLSEFQLRWTLGDSTPITLGENEWFLVESRTVGREDWFGITDWTTETQVSLQPVRAKGGCDAIWWPGAGVYEWRVIVVQGDRTTHALKGLLSPASDASTVSYGR